MVEDFILEITLTSTVFSIHFCIALDLTDLYSAISIYIFNSALQFFKPTQPNPGEDIHHTVISCVGN